MGLVKPLMANNIRRKFDASVDGLIQQAQQQ
jgi:hypothetical protein